MKKIFSFIFLLYLFNLLNVNYSPLNNSNQISYFDFKSFEFSEDNKTFKKDIYSTDGLEVGYIETLANKITTTIIFLDDRYRYQMNVLWKKIPSIRSYDIIGIGIDKNVEIVSDLYFEQVFCSSKQKCSRSIVNTPKITSTGVTSTFKLPTGKIKALYSQLYFDVKKKNDSISTKLNVYGSYLHTTRKINLNQLIDKHKINRGGIFLDNYIKPHSYELINVPVAILEY